MAVLIESIGFLSTSHTLDDFVVRPVPLVTEEVADDSVDHFDPPMKYPKHFPGI